MKLWVTEHYCNVPERSCLEMLLSESSTSCGALYLQQLLWGSYLGEHMDVRNERFVLQAVKKRTSGVLSAKTKASSPGQKNITNKTVAEAPVKKSSLEASTKGKLLPEKGGISCRRPKLLVCEACISVLLLPDKGDISC